MVRKCIMVVQFAQALHHPFHATHSLTYQLSLHFDILPPMFRVIDLFYPSTAIKDRRGLGLVWKSNLIKTRF